VFSLLTIKVDSMQGLLTLRFLAGLGLGGATPSFLALGAEYAPSRLRSFIVTTCWSAFPFGGFIGGMTASYLIPHYGWQAVFLVGGVAPVVIAIILALGMPESLRFLAAKDATDARIGRIIRRIDPGLPEDTRFQAHESAAGPKIGALFTEGRAAHTLVLWVPFFTTFMILLTVTAWTPSLLRIANMPISAAALVLAANNLGSVVGNSLAGYLVDRFGAFRILLPACLAGAASLAFFGYSATSVPLLACVSASAGFFIGGASAGFIAMAARIYPTRIRSTGIGWAMGVGRLGQILGPLAIGMLVAAKASVAMIFLAASLPCVVAGAAVILLCRLPKLAEAEEV
jgi:AAHS family 4-hydroxybenzoate transporter-like MFS transporter